MAATVAKQLKTSLRKLLLEAAIHRYSTKQVFLKTLQGSLENACAGVSFFNEGTG